MADVPLGFGVTARYTREFFFHIKIKSHAQTKPQNMLLAAGASLLKCFLMKPTHLQYNKRRKCLIQNEK